MKLLFTSKRVVATAPAGISKPAAVESQYPCPGCDGCKVKALHDSGTNATLCVRPEIPDGCRILVVGEAPGFEEDSKGVPFIGRTGSYLRDLISCLDCKDLIGYDNVIHCRPFENDFSWAGQPTVKRCRPILEETIRRVKPALIVACGAPALRWLTGEQKITVYAGSTLSYNGIPVYCINHPSHVLRQSSNEANTKYALTVANIDKAYQKAISGDTSAKVDVKVAKSLEDLDLIDKEIKSTGLFAFDTETDSLRAFAKGERVLCLSLCAKEGSAWVIPLDHPESPWTKVQRRQIMVHLIEWFSNPAYHSVAHNGKFDLLQMYANLGLVVTNYHADTMLMSYMLNEEPGGHGLKTLAYRYTDLGGYEKELDAYIAKDPKKLNPAKGGTYANVPLDVLAKYAGYDAVVTRMIYLALHAELDSESSERVPLLRLAMDFLTPLSQEIMYVESAGCLIDQDSLSIVEAQTRKKIESCKSALMDSEDVKKYIRTKLAKTNKEFKPNSPKQIREILFKQLNADPLVMTESGLESTNEETLQYLKKEHPFAEKILEYRELVKLHGTYLEPFKITTKGGKIDRDAHVRSTYLLHGTRTGRISSVGPNLQNVTSGGGVKNLYVSRWRDGRLVQGDLSQIELRIAAMLSGDRKMCRAYMDKLDLHTQTACLIYNATPEEIKDDKTKRTVAKRLNFGSVYGIGAPGIVSLLRKEGIEIDVRDAEKHLKNFMHAYPELSQWIQNRWAEAEKTGCVVSPFGRLRRLPEAKSSVQSIQGAAFRQASNAPIQSAASDLTLLSMMQVNKILREAELESKIMLTVHDSIILDCPSESEGREVAKIAQEVMQTIRIVDADATSPGWGPELYPWLNWEWITLPIVAEIEIGPTWGQLEKIKD